MINDKSGLFKVFDQMSCCFNVSNNHKFFNDFFWCESWFNRDFDRPSVFVEVKMNFFVFENFKFDTFLSVSNSDFGQILYFLDKQIKLMNSSLRMLFEELIKINFGCYDILNGLITKFEPTFYDILFNPTFSNNLTFKVHFDINWESQTFNIGIEWGNFHQLGCKHMKAFVWEVNWRCPFNKLFPFDVFEILWHIRDVDSNLKKIFINFLNWQCIIKINRSSRINCEHHFVIFFMEFSWLKFNIFLLFLLDFYIIVVEIV